MKLERRERTNDTAWRRVADDARSLERVLGQYLDRAVAVRELQAGKILTTGFADYRQVTNS